jgi:hypothetical protein
MSDATFGHASTLPRLPCGMRQQQQSTAASHKYHRCAAGLDRGLLEWRSAALQMTQDG